MTKLVAVLIILSLILGNKEPPPEQVILTPCPAEPCLLKKGVNESVEVIFKPSKH